MRYFIALIILFNSSYVYAENWGTFSGEVVTKWLDNNRDMQLLEEFKYIAPDSEIWIAPKGSIVNGASIPRFAWSIIGGPYEGAYRNASVIHDVACENKIREWKKVHRAFYTAMRASDVNIVKAQIMYAAVYHFGPRWGLKYRIKLTSLRMDQFVDELHQIKASAGPGTQVVLSNAGEIVIEKKGFLKLQEEKMVVGAIVEVYQTQPEYSKKAFDNMIERIKSNDLTLEEIEALPVDELSAQHQPSADR